MLRPLISSFIPSLFEERPIFTLPFLSRSVKMPTKLCSAVALVVQIGLLSFAAGLPQALNSSSNANTQPSTNLCGNNQHIILEGTPWLVANSMYGADRMVGTSCTYFDHIETSAGGSSQVVWSSTTDIQDVDGT